MITLLSPAEISVYNILAATGISPLAISIQMQLTFGNQYAPLPVPQQVEEPQDEESPVEESTEEEE